jgi:ribosomal protein S18 acetylase RimI-like enzyme
VDDFRVEQAPPDLVAQLWSGFTGLPIVTVNCNYDDPASVEAFVCRDENDDVQGHVSFAIEGELGEIVTLEAVQQGRHIGGRLIDAAEAEMTQRGVRRVVVTTTGDNLRAQAFYQRRGYRLKRIELDGMSRVRELKPNVPQTGYEGLPLLDMWQFEKEL